MPTNEENQDANADDEFAFLNELPKCRGLVIPLWMIEKFYVDFTSVPERLVVQLKKGQEHEESHEGS